MLQLQPYLADWRRRGFDVVFVTSASAANMRTFIEQNKITEMPLLLDPEMLALAKYRIPGYPTSFVVDKVGIITEVRVGWGTPSLNQLIAIVDRLAPK